jgi:hypothetical protein
LNVSAATTIASNNNNNNGDDGGSICDFMKTVCSGGGGVYDRKNANKILDCLVTLMISPTIGEGGVRCPELGPSDLWGVFPVDCANQECDTATTWVSGGSSNVALEGSRFINEGRAGLRLPNYKHVNSTYHNAIHYGQQKFKPKAVDMQQQKCFGVQDLSPSKLQENDVDYSLDDFIKSLFPASQVVFDSPVVAVCSRYVVEVARSEAMKFVSETSAQAALLQMYTWRDKCESKIRHLSVCAMTGVFYDMQPPPNWKSLSSKKCNIALDDLPQKTFFENYNNNNGSAQESHYLTPGCILVDRVQRKMYDAKLCAHFVNNDNNNNNNDGSGRLSAWETDVSDQCALKPQPLHLIRGDVSYSMVFHDGKRLMPSSNFWLESELSPTFDIYSVEEQSDMQRDPLRDHVSHVLDWWPEEAVAMPPGYHTTSPSDFSELAPVVFDSHYMYDPEGHVVHYVHTSARNGSLLFDVAGAAGVCRSTSVSMPMFETNTNRYCSRMAKSASQDTPTMPVDVPNIPEEETLWPYSSEFMDRYFERELCAATETEVPWQYKQDVDPQSRSAGGIPGELFFVAYMFIFVSTNLTIIIINMSHSIRRLAQHR